MIISELAPKMFSRIIIDDFRSIIDDSRSIIDDSRSIIDDSGSIITITPLVSRMAIVTDTTIWSITYNLNSDACEIFIIQATVFSNPGNCRCGIWKGSGANVTKAFYSSLMVRKIG
jgi:hypothetical protein